jgi:hypothetical protein
MAFTGINDVITAMEGGRDVFVSKGNTGSQITGNFSSYWGLGGLPAAGASPGAAAVCNSALTGAMFLPTRTGGQVRALLWASVVFPQLAAGIVVDRLAHMGGLSGIVTTAQTVNADVSGAGSSLPARIGATDYTGVRWFLEWYAATGATVVNATCAVTYSDNSTGNIVVSVPTNNGSQRMIAIQPTNGLGIKSVQSVTLSATTGTAGNFGVTALREIATITGHTLNQPMISDWANLRIVPISDDSCLTWIGLNTTTSLSAINGSVRMGVV